MTETNEQQPFQIPQRILVLRDLCIRTRGADCTRCGEACPKDALSFPEGKPPVIDDAACSLCGICQGTCDAFASTSYTLTQAHADARRAVMGARPAIITCVENVSEQDDLASNVVALPCLAMLPTELWAALLAEGADVQVSIDMERCETCAKAGGPAQALYAERIAQAEEWTQRNVGFAPSLPQAADEGLFAGLANAGADGDRRSLFTDMLSQLKDAASGTMRERTDARLQTLREQNERFAAHQRLDLGNGTQFNKFAPHGRVKRVMGSSRNLLLQALDAQPDMATQVELSLPEIDAEACEECLRCTRACPTGALLPDAQDGTLSLDWRYCIGCGLCESACPRNAITLTTKPVSETAC